ncbi:MAG: hypothetical protein GY943_19800 [Chloroflexi bacterium]|nr:hypothetical protein [Chloroflexota bacterium]
MPQHPLLWRGLLNGLWPFSPAPVQGWKRPYACRAVTQKNAFTRHCDFTIAWEGNGRLPASGHCGEPGWVGNGRYPPHLVPLYG